MSRTEILAKLKDVVDMVNGSGTATDLREDMHLVEDLGLTSVGVLYIVVGIEEMFSIQFDDVGFGDFGTIRDVVDYIEANVPA